MLSEVRTCFSALRDECAAEKAARHRVEAAKRKSIIDKSKAREANFAKLGMAAQIEMEKSKRADLEEQWFEEDEEADEEYMELKLADEADKAKIAKEEKEKAAKAAAAAEAEKARAAARAEAEAARAEAEAAKAEAAKAKAEAQRAQEERARALQGAAPAPAPAAPAPAPSSDPTLPAGWEAVLSRSTGQTYFFNAGTGESTYERPSAPSGAAQPRYRVAVTSSVHTQLDPR